MTGNNRHKGEIMTEHTHTNQYDVGRFRLRVESDHAIVDELEEFPPIMVTSNNTDDGAEPCYADRLTVLHILNELADNNHDEHKFYYLKYRLDKVHAENDYLRRINKEYKETVENTLRKEYNWIISTDSIDNNDKTVAKLTIEAIAIRLGVVL